MWLPWSLQVVLTLAISFNLIALAFIDAKALRWISLINGISALIIGVSWWRLASSRRQDFARQDFVFPIQRRIMVAGIHAVLYLVTAVILIRSTHFLK